MGPKVIFLANWIHRIRTAYSARGSLFPHAWRGLSARRHRNDTQKSPIFSVTSAGDSYPSRRAVQRALCTFTGTGQPQASLSRTGQEFAPNLASYGRYLNKRFLTRRVNLNTLKFSSGPKGTQSTRNPRVAGFLSLSQTGQSFGLFKPNGTGVAKKSPRAEGGRGEVNSPLQLRCSNTQTTRVGGFFDAFWSPLGSLLAPF